MLHIQNLHFAYGGVTALNDVSLEAPAGAITCVMGRNGVGKTTLMQNIMGLLKPASGSIVLDGAEQVGRAASARARSGVALVPQGRMIFPKLTVQENLKIGLQANRNGLKAVPERVYETFPVLKAFLARKGGDLSGGQQQQLAIARAMVGEPKVMLLDEPTEGIQPNIIQEIGRVLKRLAGEGMAVVLVEQYLDFVKEFGDGFAVMNRGAVVASGAIGELTAEIEREFLGV